MSALRPDDGTPSVITTRRGQYVPAGWVPVTRGVRYRPGAATESGTSLASAGAVPGPAVLAAWQVVLPAGSCWSHLTGAALRGWWLPPLPDAMPVVALVPPEVRRRRIGARLIRRAPVHPPELIAGVPVATATDILLDCARDLAEIDLACLVAAALRLGHCTRGDLLSAASGSGRGVRQLRRVAARTDHRHESIWEVLLAELHHACGFPVEAQYEVRDETGLFVARGDLWLPGTRTLQEYDGEHHADRRQRRGDLRRTSELQRIGWHRHGYVKEDVLYGSTRIARNAEDALGWQHSPGRTRRWHALLRESTFTPAGLQRLGARLVDGTGR